MPKPLPTCALIVAMLAFTTGLAATPGHAAPGAVPRPEVQPTVTKTFVAAGTTVQHFTVPAGVTQIQFDVEGADSNGAGGYGAQLTGTLTVTPGQVLDIWVGLEGLIGSYVAPFPGGAGGWGGRNGMRHGGTGGKGVYMIPQAGGGAGGGGATEIDLDNGAASPTVLVVAGGGGGAGAGASSGCSGKGAGGCGGLPSGAGGDGQAGIGSVTGPRPGLGGSSAGGGAGGTGGGGSGANGGGTATGEGGKGGDQSNPMNEGGGGGAGGGWGGGGGGAAGNIADYPAGGGAGGSMGPAGTTFAVRSGLGGGSVVLSYPQPADWSRFVPMTPTRLLDTRVPSDITAGKPLAAGDGLDLAITGTHGIPASGVTAVALNITAAAAAGPGYITAWPAGEAKPVVSNLNITAAGQNIANAAIVRIGADGKVSLYSQSGSDLVVDVLGYFVSTAAATSGRFTALPPGRILDTRAANGVPGTNPVPPNTTIDFVIAGRNGVPATGVAAVVLNVTAAAATAPGYITVWPTGQPQPNASNLNVTSVGQNIPNLVIVPVGTGGKVSFYTQGGGHLVADVAGWFGDGTQPSSAAGLFEPLSPSRILDTRFATGVATTTPIAPDHSVDLTVAGNGGAPLPVAFTAVVMNVTAADSTGPGFVTVWPAGQPQPVVSNLNITFAGQNIPNLVVVPISTSGAVSLYTQGGGHLVADIAGVFITG